MKVLKLCILFSILSLLISNSFVYSYPSGITGLTKKTTSSGCGSCHNSGTTITGVITGPDTVIAGSTSIFTLTLTSTSGSGKYGVDIAALNGMLSVISGQGLKLLNSELTHSSAINYSSPKAITFNYTAPALPGVDTLYATIDRGHSGAYNWAPNRRVIVKSATGIINNEIPLKYYLSQNFPNPFNPVTKINYGIVKSENVSINIYDINGKKVKTLLNTFQQTGNYYVTFDASQYSSGIYFYEIITSDFKSIKKMTLIK